MQTARAQARASLLKLTAIVMVRMIDRLWVPRGALLAASECDSLPLSQFGVKRA
jgi:hypothetical protein